MRDVLGSPRATWAALCSLTVISFLTVEKGWAGVLSTALIVAIAAMKARLVILHYMEARRTLARWRLLYELWNVSVATMLILGYLVGLGGG